MCFIGVSSGIVGNVLRPRMYVLVQFAGFHLCGMEFKGDSRGVFGTWIHFYTLTHRYSQETRTHQVCTRRERQAFDTPYVNLHLHIIHAHVRL